MSLITVTEAKLVLGPEIGDAGDALLTYFVAAVDAVVQDITGPIAAATEVEIFDGGKYHVLLKTRPNAITEVLENGSPITSYVPKLSAGIVACGTTLAPRPFYPGRQNIQITYTVGGATPANVKLAVMEQLKAFWQHSQLPNWPNVNQLPDDAEFTPSGYAIPRAVFQLLAPQARLPRVWGFA